MTFGSVTSAAKAAYSNKGAWYLLRTFICTLPPLFWFLYHKKIKSNPSKFYCHEKEFDYFYGLYNCTWNNERCVEIALALDLIQKFGGRDVLEVGNVLSNYMPTDHDILDKYDKRPNVINEDVESFRPSKKYDLIISISTLEHVGFDEIPQDDTKIPRSLGNLLGILKSNGILFVTFPIGYNNKLDEYIETKAIKFSTQLYMKRVTKENIWKQVSWDEARKSRYGSPYLAANGLVIGIIAKSDDLIISR